METKLKKFILNKEEYKTFIDSMGGCNDYTLRYDEYVKCANKAIMGIFGNSKLSPDPTSFLIVAPPGSGKTGLAAYVERHSSNIPIRIDPDMIGIYHDGFQRINEEIPETAYKELQKFVKTVLNDTIRPMACELKVDILSEGTFADTNGYIDIIKNQIEHGYKVDLSTITVTRLESLMSCFERQQCRIEKGLPPRINSVEYHDSAYNKFMKTLGIVEEENLYNSISVYERGKEELKPQLFYKTGDLTYPTAIAAIEDQRRIGLENILDNSDNYQNRIDVLRNRIFKSEDCQVKTDQLLQLDLLEKEFHELSKEHQAKKQTRTNLEQSGMEK